MVKEKFFDKLKIKHLEFIQGVITRMAYNSFLIKGWTITIVSTITLVYLIRVEYLENINIFTLFILPSIAITGFALLDAYYLYLERNYREFYNYVRKKTPDDDIDFNMKAVKDNKEHGTSRGYWGSFWSTTVALSYSGLLFCIICTVVFIKYSPLCLWHKIKTLLNLLC